MTNPKVDWYFEKSGKWQEAQLLLRSIVLESGLEETLKWGCPCYTRENRNIALIHGFKDYCALLFMQGALLNDPKQLLTQQTTNVQSARQMRFTHASEITKHHKAIAAFLKEAIKNDKAGLKVELKKTDAYTLPEELTAAFKEMPELKKAFQQLTPGRQRAYILFFAGAKQAKTRLDRVAKYIPKILAGKGMDD